MISYCHHTRSLVCRLSNSANTTDLQSQDIAYVCRNIGTICRPEILVSSSFLSLSYQLLLIVQSYIGNEKCCNSCNIMRYMRIVIIYYIHAHGNNAENQKNWKSKIAFGLILCSFYYEIQILVFKFFWDF